MKKSSKSVDVYEVYGKSFLDEHVANKYENAIRRLLKHKYMEVTYQPELTEGRGYSGKMIVGVPRYGNRNTLIHYLTKTLGDPLAFVQAVSPMDNWVIGKEIDFEEDWNALKKYLTSERKVRGYKRERVKCVWVNDKGEDGKKALEKGMGMSIQDLLNDED